MAQMTATAINDLPDSAFAYIEPGGSKDESGRTVPRSLRHFPIHDAAHVRNALARAPQSPFGDKAMSKIKAAAKKFGIRAVIGKGGMGAKTLKALQEHGGVYLNAIGGAAQYYAECFKKVNDVHFLKEFGIPEAMWHLQTEGFAAIVTMDSHGNSLHAEVEQSSREKLEQFKAPVFK